MTGKLAPASPRVSAFLEKVQASHRGRLLFIVDATGSREPAWDMASKLQVDMFNAAAGIGTLDVQVVYFRGMQGVDGECRASPWTSDAQELARFMARVTCRTGPTQIQAALEHARKEHRAQPLNAIVYVGDMCEERAQAIYDATASLSGVPLFVFQEGDDAVIAGPIFQEMARLSHGAYSKFTAGSARELAELLRAVAVFATGGLTALSDLRTDAAVKLLGQMKK
jgi:hypothetical protein